MEGDGSPLSSLCMVRAAELFPRPEPEKEDHTLKVPFTELAGEFVRYIGRTDDGILAMSNYRICLKSQTATAPETEISIPLNVIEYVTVRDLFQLMVSCKDASTFKCSFPTSEQCSEWQRRITLSIGVPTSLESLFAFSYYAWASETQQNSDNEWIGRMQRATNYDEDFRREVKRLEFNMNTTWRISTVNVDFKLCPSYPRLILVPACITDETLSNVATFRSSRRIPAVVWRHRASGAVIGRCSQPEVGWLGWRNPKDEQLLKAIAEACSFDGGEMGRRQVPTNITSASENSSTDGSHEEVCMDEVKKILIVDARSYASAVTNRARGGGCECPEYYPCAAIEFMSLGNIHVIRKSFHALRSLAASPADSQSWFTALDRTMWLTHLAGMMQSAMRICHVVEREGRSVVVHCSDGWDRTPQLVSTALLCLDPYYRTVEGFKILVEREWLSFGHKFADRIGHGPGSDETNERCPVFLQWLDCVHQIQKQFPCSFEFSVAYLIKLAQHVFSCMFGTFLCNTYKERIDNSVFDRTYSVWPFLSGPIYRNPLYIANREQVLWPAYHPSNLSFWSEVYGSSFGNQNQSDSSMTTSISPTAPVVASVQGVGTTIVTPSTNDISNSEPRSPMIKTRSYGDLQTAGCNGIPSSMIRRSSDPNMSVDAHFNMNLSSGPSIETLPEHYANGIDIDVNVINDQTIANFCSDTVRELNNLTEELQHTNLNNDIDVRINDERQQNGRHNQIPNHTVESSTDPNECVQNGHIDIDSKQDHNFDHTYAMSIPNNNNEIMNETPDREQGSGNYINGDVVDSSPFYTQSDQRLENATNGEIRRRASIENHRQIYNIGYENGVGNKNNYVSNGDENDNNGETSMMQSVDLRDTSPLLSPSSNIQSQWHGNIETSTDTLVPVLDTTNQQNNFDCAEYKSPYEYGDESHYNFFRPKVFPEVNSHFKKLHIDSTTNPMDESILIQPEQSCMDIANGHRRDSVSVPNANINYSSLYRRRQSSSNSKNLPTYAEVVGNQSTSRSDSISPVPINSKFSSLNTNRPSPVPNPTSIQPSLSTQTSATNIISYCPDGLAHTLSEQNLRLQQIVYEHKIREEALQKELQALRLALLRKRSCSSCSNGHGNNAVAYVVDETDDDDDDDESLMAKSKCSSSVSSRQSSEGPCSNILMKNSSRTSSRTANSLIDNGVENVSICSWEAVEERNGASSIKNFTNALNASSVLWVPDHAVHACVSCHTEFWLGRRKHHCRSCGYIYCADCAGFFAPLPGEHLYTPVRLCGPCYHSVTTKGKEQNSSSINATMSSSNHVQNSNLHCLSNPSTSSCTTLEPCKNSMVTSKTDQSPTKATTVMN